MYDLLSITSCRISVSLCAKKSYVFVPYSNLIVRCLEKIYSLGYISGFKIYNLKNICVSLKYVNAKPVIRRIKRISTPGNRIYFRASSLRKSNNFQGFYILSTSRGVLTDQECLFYNIGGEPLYLVI